MRLCSDFLLLGQSKKKVVIKETDKKIYDIHISSIHSESISVKRIYDFSENILIASREGVDVMKELEKILGKYIFQINKIECNKEPTTIYKIFVEIQIEKEKGLWSRWVHFLKS